MDCPNEETLLALAEGRLADESAVAYSHVESCESCRLVMRELARSYGRDEEPLRAGQRLGAYRLIAPLGQGGMGVVWRAEDTELGRAVAVKFMVAPLADDAEALARFSREAKSAAALDHPHLGAVFGTGEHQGRPYLVMAFYEGETLKQRLKRDRPRLDEALQILEQLAAGLGAAHARGLVHRDVKPSNVMLSPAGVRLLDFGLAKFVAPEESLTRTGELVGTLAYMAPEQLRGAPVDPRADVWSFGVVAFELFAGAPPFIGTAEQIAHAMNADEPPSLRARKPELPRALERFVHGCLAKDPAHRYPSAIELLSELKRVRAGEPLKARGRGRADRLLTQARRHRVAVALALLASVALAVAGVEIGARRASSRRLERAHELAARVERSADALRQARLLPTHDVTPARTELSAAIAAVGHERDRLAPEGTATCARAAGDGLLALGDYKGARGELEQAWQLGERSPEVAYALGVDLAYLYRREIADARGIADATRRQAREHDVERNLRDPAIAALRNATAAPGVSARYVEALIANAEGRTRDSLEAARTAFAEQPSLFEAGQLAAAAQATLATQAWNTGKRDEARALTAQAGETWRRVLDIARSDEESHRVYADYTLASRALYEQPPADLYQRVIDACEQAVKIDPKSRAYTIEAFVWFQRAFDLTPDQDPRPLLGRGEAIAHESLRRDGTNWQAEWALGTLLGVSGGWKADHGIDPRPDLEQAVAALARALAAEPAGTVAANQAANLLDLAHWESRHGIDPRPRFDAIVKLWTTYDDLDRDSPYGTQDLGQMWIARARYELEHGGDPQPSLRGLDAAIARLARIDVSGTTAHRFAGMRRVIAAEQLLATGGDPRDLFDATEKSFAQAIAGQDPTPYLSMELARARLVRARVELAHGGDPRPALALAHEAIARAEKTDAHDLETQEMRARLELWTARAERKAGRDARPALEHAATAVARALAILPEDAMALTLRAAIVLERARRPGALAPAALDAAISDCRHAQAIDARLAQAFDVEARLLELRARTGRPADAAALADRADADRRRAAALDPLHVYAVPTEEP